MKIQTLTYNGATGETTVSEREMTAEEIAAMEAMQQIEPTEPQPTLEQRVEAVEEATEEVITALNQKGIVP